MVHTTVSAISSYNCVGSASFAEQLLSAGMRILRSARHAVHAMCAVLCHALHAALRHAVIRVKEIWHGGRNSVLISLIGQRLHDGTLTVDSTGCVNSEAVWCRPGNAPAAYLGSRPTSDSLQVQPGPSWRALLLTPDGPPSWLQGLLSHLQGRPDAALAQQARQLVVSSAAVPVTPWIPCQLCCSHHAIAHSHEFPIVPRSTLGLLPVGHNQKQPQVLQNCS